MSKSPNKSQVNVPRRIAKESAHRAVRRAEKTVEKIVLRSNEHFDLDLYVPTHKRIDDVWFYD